MFSRKELMSPKFNSEGVDELTYAPFVLKNALDTEYRDVRLSFSDWKWLNEKYGRGQSIGNQYIGDYYLNGYGIEALVKSLMFKNGFDLDSDDLEFDSEGDTCYIHFKSLERAVSVAELASSMISDIHEMEKMIQVARDEGFDD